MGGRVKKGYSIVGGVVKNEVKDYYDSLVDGGIFESRSEAIGFILTEFVNKCEREECREV
jgi:Arc/MetJ-type ribon-helix-helix transcriptional regulator